MLTGSKKFQDLLSEVNQRLNSGEFPPSWSEISQLGGLSEPAILEHIFSKAASSSAEDIPYDACEYLLHCTLLELMIEIRHGQSAPKNAWEKLQKMLVTALNSEQSNDELITLILDHISTHNLPLSPETLDATIFWQQNKFEPTEAEQSLSQEEINIELINHLEQLQISSEFEFYQLFADRLTFFADESIEGFVCDLLGASQSILREGALLFLLHKRKAVRLAIIEALQSDFFQKKISPTGLRRLITSRNWLSPDEKRQIDKAIKSIRRLGTPCESASVPETIKLIKMYTSTTDGVGAASVISIFKVGRQFTLVGAILKEHYGVLDTWVSPLTTRKECENQIRHMKSEIYCLETDEEWVRCVLPHYLALNVQSEEPLTAETLLWTEWLGLNIWQPQPLDLLSLLNRWHEEHPSLFNLNAHEKAFNRSAKWLEKSDFAQGWFEQDDKLETRVNNFFSHNIPETSPSTVDYLLAPHRKKWRDRFILLALWAKHNCKTRGPQWQDFAIISEAIDSKKDLHDIPIMRSIAYNTLDYYSTTALQAEESPSLHAVPSTPVGSVDENHGEELFFQVLGFLCAICCNPKIVKPESWLPYLLECLFLDFDDQDNSGILDAFIEDTLIQYDAITSQLETARLSLNEGSPLNPLQCSYWSEGFMYAVEFTGGLKKWDKRWKEKEHEPLRAGLSLIDASAKEDANADSLLSAKPDLLNQLVTGFYESLRAGPQ